MMNLPRLIIFMRHGIAMESAQWQGPDDDRPLTRAGEKKTRLAAMGMLTIVQPTIVVASGLKRAEQTADAVYEAFSARGLPPPHRRKTTALHHSGTYSGWKKYLKDEIPDHGSGKILLAIGHEPSLSLIVAGHLGLTEPVFKFKKSGIAVVRPRQTLDTCELVAFVPPKMLRGMSL